MCGQSGMRGPIARTRRGSAFARTRCGARLARVAAEPRPESYSEWDNSGMKPTMRAYTIQVESGNTVLALRAVPVPVAGAGQVLVRLHAAGLNRGEFVAMHGLHAKGGAPKPAGFEGAGEIVALGAGVAGLKAGDRVMGRCGGRSPNSR